MAPPRGRNGGGGSGSLRMLVMLVAVGLVVAIAFGGGILVGRHWESAAAREADPREPGAAAPAKKGAAGKRAADADAERSREGGDKLTFYHTLAAPLSAPPSYPKPAADAKARPAAPTSATSATATSAGAGHAATPGASPGATTGPTASAPAAHGAPTAAPAGWTVQVGAFGNRQQADTLQQDLRRAGFEAFLAPLGTSDGQTRYRVRVGTFADKALAQRAADRLRSERSLPTFVTTN